MLLIPEIVLQEGRCLRSPLGDQGAEPALSDTPAEMASYWIQQNARRLHLTALNHVTADKQKNETAIRTFVKAINTQVPLQFEGHICDFDTIERVLDDGISYVVLGPSAVQNPGFLQDACLAFSGSIIARLDAKEGKAIAHSRSKLAGHNIADLARKFEDYGCTAILYTDTEHAGPLHGLTLEVMISIANTLYIPVIANARQIHLTDIDTLCTMREHGIEGILYSPTVNTNEFDFSAVQKRIDARCDSA